MVSTAVLPTPWVCHVQPEPGPEPWVDTKGPPADLVTFLCFYALAN